MLWLFFASFREGRFFNFGFKFEFRPKFEFHLKQDQTSTTTTKFEIIWKISKQDETSITTKDYMGFLLAIQTVR